MESKTGLKQSVLSKLENGDRKITLKALSQVVEALGGEWELKVKLPNRKAVTLVDSGEAKKIA
jgi:transcriptional regulator with XRE-family HTH domain